MYTASQLLDKINSHISDIQFTRTPAGLYDPIKYVLSMGGKRIRPVLMLMAYNLYKEDVSSIYDPATAIEVYHNYTLLHDDLMDRADMRRGKTTVHKVWNDNTAILSGDAMLVLAYQYMAASLKIGAILGGASPEDAENLYDFGMQIGVAFQLQDDLLDVYGDPAVFGKNIGGDILCNKKTYMLIKALERADRDQLEGLNHWLSATSFCPEEKISAVTELYTQIGIKAVCENKMREYYTRAMTSLGAVSVIEDKKSELKKLMKHLMYREM